MHTNVNVMKSISGVVPGAIILTPYFKLTHLKDGHLQKNSTIEIFNKNTKD